MKNRLVTDKFCTILLFDFLGNKTGVKDVELIISGDAALYPTPDCWGCGWGWGEPFHLYSKTARWN